MIINMFRLTPFAKSRQNAGISMNTVHRDVFTNNFKEGR